MLTRHGHARDSYPARPPCGYSISKTPRYNARQAYYSTVREMYTHVFPPHPKPCTYMSSLVTIHRTNPTSCTRYKRLILWIAFCLAVTECYMSCRHVCPCTVPAIAVPFRGINPCLYSANPMTSGCSCRAVFQTT